MAKKEDFIIMGRCADVILTNHHIPHVSIFINAPFELRARRVMETDDLTYKKACKMLKKLDRRHRAYYEFYTGRKWGSSVNYDLCINSASYGIEGSVQLIERIINQHTATSRSNGAAALEKVRPIPIYRLKKAAENQNSSQQLFSYPGAWCGR